MPSLVLVLCALLPPLGVLADKAWCTFWADDSCKNRYGHVNYEIGNPHTFQNSGPYFNCGSGDEFTIVSYPPGDQGGNNPRNCHVFPEMGYDECAHLSDLGFTTDDGGWYRLSYASTCPATSISQHSERELKTLEQPELPEAKALLLRDSNYLRFYADPACEQHVSSVNYATGNAGCFENGGGYVEFGGDDSNWHLEQWTGVDEAKCTGAMEACVKEIHFGFQGCISLEDKGFSPGYGSYRIGRGGCP